MEEIVVNLLWHPQAQFAGYLVAEKRRLGASRGVALRTTPLDFALGPVRAVLEGAAQFAVASPSHLLKSPRAAELTTLLVVQQDSALVYPARRSSGIASLADLAGRKVGVWPGGEDLELRWMLHRAGLAPDAVARLPMNDTVRPFLDGDIDCAQMTLYHELHQVVAAGLAEDSLRIFRASEIGAALVKDGLFTTRRLVEQRPELVQAVVDTVLEGWAEAFARPVETAAICAESWPGLDRPGQEAQLADIRGLAQCGATLRHGLGYPDPQHAARAAMALSDLGAPVAADIVADATDDRFWMAAPAGFKARGR